MRAVAVTAILLTVTLAGCASGPDPLEETTGPVFASLDDLSQPIYDILPVEELFVTASDGKGMHTAIYRPDTPDNVTVPVFINFSPYWGDTAETGGDAFSQYMIDEYVPRGYAVVLAAIRGTGHSEGCFSIGGDRELEDLYDVVDFFANEAWSNGAVAAGGKSYDSTTQNGMIAKYPHPALKGIFHVSGITDMYAYNYHNGVPYTQGPIFNTYYYLQGTDEYGASLIGAGGTDDEDVESLARLIDDAACPDLPFVQAHGIGSGVTGLKTDYWVERDWTQHIGDSDWNGSIFFVHGFQDWNVKPDHILPWIDNLPEDIRVKGWLHQWQEGGTGHVYPMRTDWNETMLRWMDSELKGIDTGFWAEPAWDLQGTDMQWRSATAWPNGTTYTFEEAAAPSGGVQVGVSGDNVRTLTFDPGQSGAGNATGYHRITGSPHIQVTVTPRSADPIITATIHVGGQWVGEAVLRGIYDDGTESPAPVTPGVPATFTLDAYPLDVVIPPGEAITIVLGDSPRQSLTTPAGTAPVVYDGAVSFTATFADATARADQPTPMECFAC